MSPNTSVPVHGIPPAEVLERLRELRTFDAPTHGGRVLSYVYDSGRPELDRLASEAAELSRPLNGLDPTAFPSIAVMERDLVGFVRRALGGDRRRLGGRIVGSVTSGGTESCLLAVKTARDLWRKSAAGRAILATNPAAKPRLVAPMTVHSAFHKAARIFDLELDLVPCEPDGTVYGQHLTRRLGDDVALVVVSAPAYPVGSMDPVGEVSRAALALGISCHVDACFGGLVMPWWPGTPKWDFRLPGVTSISADLHKFGYAPKGVSVLLHRGRIRHRAQFFALAKWPGYPIVNPTLLGSKSASPLAAAWAIVQRLGAEGYRELTASCVRSVRAITEEVDRIRGLRVLGPQLGPAIALVADETVPAEQRVDPHLLADEITKLGFTIQHQPGVLQSNGVRLPHSAHLTITPVTERSVRELSAALHRAADAVRGKPRASVAFAATMLRALGYDETRVPTPAAAWAILRVAGAAPKRPSSSSGVMPSRMAPLMALVEQIPGPVAEALLTELLARVSER